MRYSSLIAATGLLASGLLAGQPAQAAPVAQAAETFCTINMPGRISISTDTRKHWITRRCDGAPPSGPTSNCKWFAKHASGYTGHELEYLTSAVTDDWNVIDTLQPLGRIDWIPFAGTTVGRCWNEQSSDTVPAETKTTYVKVASWAGVTATRSGSKVTLTASAARYAGSLDRFVPWAKAFGQIQYKARGTTTWRALKSAYTNNGGKIYYSYTSATARDYRVVLPQTNVIWNATSKTVVR